MSEECFWVGNLLEITAGNSANSWVHVCSRGTTPLGDGSKKPGLGMYPRKHLLAPRTALCEPSPVWNRRSWFWCHTETRESCLSPPDSIVPWINVQNGAQEVTFPESVLLVRALNQSTAVVNWQDAFSLPFFSVTALVSLMFLFHLPSSSRSSPISKQNSAKPPLVFYASSCLVFTLKDAG